MRREFKLPDVGEGMSEGTLLAWMVDVGSTVEEGQPVAEVSTDKVDFEVPSPMAGVIVELMWSPGDVVPVGSVLMVIDTTREESAPGTDDPGQPTTETVPDVQEQSGRDQIDAAVPQKARVIASPVLRRRAAELGIDLTTIRGSGPGGRITDADLRSATEPAAATEPQQTLTQRRPEAESDYRVERVTGVRAVAARRMSQSVQTAATSTTTFRVRADAVISFLESGIEGQTPRDRGASPLAVILASVACALLEHPRLNATFEDGGEALRLHNHINMAVAVATDDGLMVPVIRHLEDLDVFQIGDRLRDLADRARTGRLSPEDVGAGSFTLSSTGGLEHADIVSTLPIINPPQTATMWVSRIRPQPRNEGGGVGIGPILTASLSFDHRFIDGADATRFINDLTRILESGEAVK